MTTLEKLLLPLNDNDIISETMTVHDFLLKHLGANNSSLKSIEAKINEVIDNLGNVDLSEYSTTEEINQMFDLYKNTINTMIEDAIGGIDMSLYSTTEEVRSMINRAFAGIKMAEDGEY